MIQVLVMNAQAEGTISVPPPILSRVYQTLSRGFVNLLDAKKIKDTKFPFPYAQAIAVLLLLLSVITPITLSSMIPYVTLCAVSTFVPVFGLLCLNYAAEELEMPFGEDSNDLPLSHFQEEMNSSLLMLIHDWSDHLAKTNSAALRDWESLSSSLHDCRKTENFYVPDASGGKRKSMYTCQTTDMSADDHVSSGDSEYAGWSDLPAEADEGSNVASADVAKNDGTVVDGHASKPVMQPPIPVEVDTRQPLDPVLNSPGGDHGERVQALVSAAMSLQGSARMVPAPGDIEDCASSSHPSTVGITVTRNTSPPKTRPMLPGRSALIAGALPVSPTFAAAPSKSSRQPSQERSGETDTFAGPSRWSKDVIETPKSHKGDVGIECEKNAGTPGGLGGQFFSGFASNPT
jgi:hypothetical protein